MVTATAPHVLEGDVFVDAQGNPVDGTMADKSGYGAKLNTSIYYARIPKGYHDGTGIVQAVYQSYKIVMPTKEEQTVKGETFKGDDGLTREKFLGSVTVRPIPD